MTLLNIKHLNLTFKTNDGDVKAINDLSFSVKPGIIYGIAGIALLVSGIYRVIKFGQGSEFYTQNPIFWTKIIVFALVGSLSLYPTITYVLWAVPLSKGTLPQVTESLVSRLRLIINVELVGFASIPFLATLMARGVGLG